MAENDANEWGDGISPDQTEIQVEPAPVDLNSHDLLDYLNTHLKNHGTGAGGQWRCPNFWVELSGGVKIFNARNMRYLHASFAMDHDGITRAIAFMDEHKDSPTPLVVPEQFRIENEYR